MGLSRLAALHGVATSFSPSADVTVSVPDVTVTAVLAALGVEAATPADVGRSLAAAESAAASRLLPPTVVIWSGEPLSPARRTAARHTPDGRPGARHHRCPVAPAHAGAARSGPGHGHSS